MYLPLSNIYRGTNVTTVCWTNSLGNRPESCHTSRRSTGTRQWTCRHESSAPECKRLLSPNSRSSTTLPCELPLDPPAFSNNIQHGNSAFYPSGTNKCSTNMPGWGYGCVGWQVTRCDPNMAGDAPELWGGLPQKPYALWCATASLHKQKVNNASCLQHLNKRKKSPANAKGNAQQRCMCEGSVRTESKFTTMFHLDSMTDDA